MKTSATSRFRGFSALTNLQFSTLIFTLSAQLVLADPVFKSSFVNRPLSQTVTDVKKLFDRSEALPAGTVYIESGEIKSWYDDTSNCVTFGVPTEAVEQMTLLLVGTESNSSYTLPQQYRDNSDPSISLEDAILQSRAVVNSDKLCLLFGNATSFPKSFHQSSCLLLSFKMDKSLAENLVKRLKPVIGIQNLRRAEDVLTNAVTGKNTMYASSLRLIEADLVSVHLLDLDTGNEVFACGATAEAPGKMVVADTTPQNQPIARDGSLVSEGTFTPAESIQDIKNIRSSPGEIVSFKIQGTKCTYDEKQGSMVISGGVFESYKKAPEITLFKAAAPASWFPERLAIQKNRLSSQFCRDNQVVLTFKCPKTFYDAKAKDISLVMKGRWGALDGNSYVIPFVLNSVAAVDTKSELELLKWESADKDG